MSCRRVPASGGLPRSRESSRSTPAPFSNVTGGATATDTPYLLDVTGPTTLAGNSTIDVANNGTGLGTLHLDDVSQSGGNFSLTKTGAGTLVLSGALSFAVLNTNEGTTNLDSELTNGTINDNGGKLNINASQTLTALNIGAGGVVVLGGSAPAALGVRRGNCRGRRASRARARFGRLFSFGALGWLARRQRGQRTEREIILRRWRLRRRPGSQLAPDRRHCRLSSSPAAA